MILNPWTVTTLFLDAVGFLLALPLLILAMRLPRSQHANLHDSAFHDRRYLIALILFVLAGLRLITWPLFYWLLDSYVPVLAHWGVMCAFGVAELDQPLVRVLEIVKPIALLAVGFALISTWAMSDSETHRTRRRVGTVVGIAALLICTECFLEISFVWREKTGATVTCCTRFLDTAANDSTGRLNSFSPSVPFSQSGLITLWASVSALICGSAWMVARMNARHGKQTPVWEIALPLFGAFGLFFTLQLWQSVLAPRVLQLPYHHCLYEILTDYPLLTFTALATIIGHLCLCFPAILRKIYFPDTQRVHSYRIQIYEFCALLVVSQIIVVTVHLF